MWYFLQGVLFHTICLLVAYIVATAAAIPRKEVKPNYETVVHDMVLLHPQGTVRRKNKNVLNFKNDIVLNSFKFTHKIPRSFTYRFGKRGANASIQPFIDNQRLFYCYWENCELENSL